MKQLSGIFFINQVMDALRSYFQKQNILSFSSPILVKSAAMEPYLDAFEAQGDFGNYYLPTSPEFSLKKAWAFYPQDCAGIYDIAHAFRDENLSNLHRHEFTMLEWYRRDSSYEDIPKDISEILKIILETGKKFSLSPNFNFFKENTKIYTVSELFEKFLNFSLTPQTSLQELENLAKENRIYFSKENSFEKKNHWIELYSLLMDECIEPRFKELEKIIFVKDYPPLTRAMSKLNQEGWASRIECYICAKEIANGYQELSEKEELKKTWQENNQLRLLQNKKIHPLDENLIEFTNLMKNVSGTAMGLERVILALYPQFSLHDFFLP